MSVGTATVPDLTNELLGELGVSFADEVDKAAESSGDVLPGKYHARLDGATIKDPAGQTPRWEIWFLILAGTFRGRKTKYTIWLEANPNEKGGAAKTPEKLAQDKARIKNELDHAAGVLGVKVKLHGEPARKYLAEQLKGREGLTADQIARALDAVASKGIYAPVPGKHDFRDAINAECVVKTVLRPSGRDGDDRKFAEVDNFGVLAFSDPKAKGVVLAGPGEKVAAPAPASRAAAQEDMSDLVSNV